MNVVIAGRIIPNRKHVVIGLTSIFGIGRKTSSEICEKLKIDPTKHVEKLTPEEIDRIRETISEYTVEGDLRRKYNMDKKKLLDMGSYRGKRHRNALPVRGQRTKTNARTRKGKKRG